MGIDPTSHLMYSMLDLGPKPSDWWRSSRFTRLLMWSILQQPRHPNHVGFCHIATQIQPSIPSVNSKDQPLIRRPLDVFWIGHLVIAMGWRHHYIIWQRRCGQVDHHIGHSNSNDKYLFCYSLVTILDIRSAETTVAIVYGQRASNRRGRPPWFWWRAAAISAAARLNAPLRPIR